MLSSVLKNEMSYSALALDSASVLFSEDYSNLLPEAKVNTSRATHTLSMYSKTPMISADDLKRLHDVDSPHQVVHRSRSKTKDPDSSVLELTNQTI